MATAQSDYLPVNWNAGVEVCGGDEDMFRMMLSQFESLALDKELKNAHETMMLFSGTRQDFEKMRMHAYILKHPFGYIGAQKYYDMSDILMKAARVQDNEGVIKNYIALLYEIKPLKMFLADANQREFDPKDIDRYIKETQDKYFGGKKYSNMKFEGVESSADRSVCQTFCNQF